MYQYEVHWWNRETKSISYGLVPGDNFNQAMINICAHFGNENISKCKLSLVSNSCIAEYTEGIKDLSNNFDSIW